jgi:hypothetical protein
MVTLQENKKVLIGFGILTGIMFIIVMFIINPLIDGKTGMGVIKLQLAFTTQNGKSILNGWNVIGQQNFLKYIYTDYIYAFAYSFFLSSLYLNKVLKNNIKLKGKYLFIFILPFVAGLFDMIENTIEILFIKNPNGFPELLFSFHTILSSLKWLGLPIILYFLIKRIK